MKHTDLALSRRTVLGAAAAAGLGATLPVWAQGKDPIQFATLLDFTRVYTFLTDEYSQGQQDYIKLVNLEGGVDGHPIKLIIKDHASYPERGIAQYNEAKAAGAVFFDFLSSPVANALMPRVDEDHLPMIAFAHGRADAADGQAFPYVFPSAAIYRSQAALLLKYIDEHEGGLKGKKIAFVHIDSAFGKEPIELLERVAKTKGFELKLYPYPVPGTEQAATWSEVRKNRPDKIIIWGAGPGQAVSIRGAVTNGISPKDIHSVLWLSESDMSAFKGNEVVGVKRVTLVNTGSDNPILKRIIEKVITPGNGSGDKKRVGWSGYNIGVASMAIAVEAATLALKNGGGPLTGEKLKAGFEMIKGYTADGLMPPLTITAQDHQGGGQGLISEWDGKRWAPKSEWGSAYQDVVWDLIKEDQAKAKEKK
ncbi:ABC transporter substrate-binding protein [Comamonas flocculans]|uniref:ABC transporter substrate-binding protein n=1 Tax=Comamonas flocculans TaxID=2597701 RepID=A0A5B8RVF2_9BURK|nr:ABC transporter substrate-binding protein [Comamonas flocculans]QEA13470.1 ABC transporter substrate-binding protein [Comamonas flocculans]